ncbi:MAG TPA: zinc-dependent alcohol dehydrogenase family protein [Candidatus Saccharimonadales bacterium]|jgi:propanol-preferring alcohol dehydrogenase|nr:zinc-dependent alcohol dehydrogenase family protein [Candidatus Saccharimonadales bacterium]
MTQNKTQNKYMRAMVLDEPGKPLTRRDWPVPQPGTHQVLLQVLACAVCRTDLHVVDGELPDPKLPLVLGHEIVARVASLGEDASLLSVGQRVGVPWLGWTCGKCFYCLRGSENLCVNARFTGYTLDGGYAEFTVADERYCVPIPESYSDGEAAPLLCAGLIGYRSLVRAGDARRLGIYGFGAAAHIITQVARHQGRSVYAFTRAGDEEAQNFARELGAVWAGASDERPPDELDAAIIFAPVGALVPAALAAVRKGGNVVCGGIHMSDIPQFSYDLLWGERSVSSVANLTRKDAAEFMDIAPKVPVRTTTENFKLEDANEALSQLRSGKVHGAAVLKCS